MNNQVCLQSLRIASAAFLLVSSASMAHGQYFTGAGGAGAIEFRSGFPPFDRPPGYASTTPLPWAPLPLVLQRWHLSPFGYAEGGTALRAAANPFAWAVVVPTTSYLVQAQNPFFFSRPAQINLWFDAIFPLGDNALPPQLALLSYPLLGRNAPGLGSFVYFEAELRYGYRDPLALPGNFTSLGNHRIVFGTSIPGLPFALRRSSLRYLPTIPAGQQFLVWGSLRFVVRSRPPTLSGGSPLTSIAAAVAAAAPDEMSEVRVVNGGPGLQNEVEVVEFPPDLVMPGVFPEIVMEDNVEFTEIRSDDNHAPLLNGISPQTGMEEQLLTFTAVATDPDEHPITYSLAEGAPAGASIDPATGVFTWTPSAGQSGTHLITVEATDNSGNENTNLTAQQQVRLTINSPTNTAPVLSSVASVYTVGEGEALSIQATATDADPLTFSLEGAVPPGASIDPQTGVLTWTPTESQGPSTFRFSVRVTDSGGLWDEIEITVTVNEVDNGGPAIDAIPEQTLSICHDLNLQVSASDPDRDPLDPNNSRLEFTLTAAPAGARIDENGVIHWIPDGSQGGGQQQTFTVRATDTAGAIGEQTFVVTVNGTPTYLSNFETGAGAEWSSTQTGITPIGERQFLGEFAGNDSVSLTLSDLPEHSVVRVSFDLFIIRSWDGNRPDSPNGPDIWRLSADETPVFETTFSNPHLHQAYPDSFPGGVNFAGTGAVERNTLGFLWRGAVTDSVYRVTYEIPHSASSVVLGFAGIGLQGLADESWGIDNVTVCVE